MVTTLDERIMRKCLKLAANGGREVEPNPLVGCVIMKEGSIIGTGWHRKFGGQHAERIALARAGDAARGSTLYVNLEPCNHFGKTPPCTESIIEAGIRRVVIGMRDPNPHVLGGGIQRLREANIECEIGVLEEDCRNLNTRFLVNTVYDRPYVILKVAQTLDGFIATVNGQSKWITSEESRKEVHKLRASVDAVLVGANTIRLDNPSLTVRYNNGRNPIRVVLSSSLNLRANSAVFSDDAVTLVLTTNEALKKKWKFVQSMTNRMTDFIGLKSSGLIKIKSVLQALYKRGVNSLLVEGGTNVFSSFLQAEVADRLDVFIAPIVIGKGLSPFEQLRPRSLSNARSMGRTIRMGSGNDTHIIIHNIE